MSTSTPQCAESNLNALANNNEFVAQVTLRIAGNAAANTMNGAPIDPADLRSVIAPRQGNLLTANLNG